MLHVNFLTLLRVLEVNLDLRHVNHIRYYYYFIIIIMRLDERGLFVYNHQPVYIKVYIRLLLYNHAVC